MSIEFRRLDPGDENVLTNVAPQVFDDSIVADATTEFLNDPRHHLVVATDDDRVIGFASAVTYFHPDKTRPELWINEVGVAPSHQRQGVARGLLDKMFDVARAAGCSEACVLTERSKEAAMQLYASLGGCEAHDTMMFTFSLDA
jgi:GNAT superfamily N-acetyltransferase